MEFQLYDIIKLERTFFNSAMRHEEKITKYLNIIEINYSGNPDCVRAVDEYKQPYSVNLKSSKNKITKVGFLEKLKYHKLPKIPAKKKSNIQGHLIETNIDLGDIVLD